MIDIKENFKSIVQFLSSLRRKMEKEHSIGKMKMEKLKKTEEDSYHHRIHLWTSGN